MLYTKVLLFAISCILLLGCGKQESSGISVLDDLGNRVAMQPNIKRAVSLAPNVTEILAFLGKQSIVKGVTRYCNYPAIITNRVVVGGIIKPDLEKIIRLRPQVVFLSFEANSAKIAESVKNAGLSFYAVQIRSIAEMFNSLQRISSFLKAGKKAKQKIKQLKKQLESLRNSMKGKRVFIYFADSAAFYTFGKKTLVAEFIRHCGAINTGDLGVGAFPKMNREMLHKLKPDLVVLLINSRKSALYKKSVALWKKISPQARVVAADPDIFSRPGPRLIYGFKRLAETR